jgi:hypothetical protein
VPGKILATQPERFVPRWFQDQKFPGISWKTFEKEGFANAWGVFDEAER